MRKIHCLNPISKLGTGLLTENYEMTDNLAEAEGILVRSAAMHDLELPKGLRAVARAGAGVNNIPLDKCAEAGVVVFNTPGANANGVKELMDYLDNGNIKNSVNFPNCDMGVCTTVGRLALLHKNVPNMIGQISSILASTDMNIANMTNKSRDKYAYTLVDLETKADAATIEKLKAIQGMMRVRVIK